MLELNNLSNPRTATRQTLVQSATISLTATQCGFYPAQLVRFHAMNITEAATAAKK